VPVQQARNLLVPAHVAARDRACADVVVVLVDRRRVVRRLRTVPVVKMPSFRAAPAEVDAPPPPRVDRAVVDLLPRALTHVAKCEVPGHAVEREAPRVADTVRPDLWLPGRLADERVVRGHRVRVRPV